MNKQELIESLSARVENEHVVTTESGKAIKAHNRLFLSMYHGGFFTHPKRAEEFTDYFLEQMNREVK